MNPQALDRLLNPVPNGLYDLALGPIDKNDICLTCGLSYFTCPGHFGHINLALTVYNPVFFKDLIKILRSACLSCHQLLTTKLEKDYFYAQLTVIHHGKIDQLGLVDDLFAKILNNNDPKILTKVSFRKDFDDLIEFILSNRENSTETSCVKNLVAAKIDALKVFMSTKAKVSQKNCPNCMLPLRKLRSEHNSKLFFAKGVSARQIKKNKNTKLSKIREELDEIRPDPEGILDEMNGLSIDGDTTQNGDKTIQENGNQEDEDEEDEDKLDNLVKQSYLTPIEAKKHLQKLFKKEPEIMRLILGRPSLQQESTKDESELFFFDSIAVPPSKFRPISQFKEQRFENGQTAQLSKLLQQNIVLKEILIEIMKSGKQNFGQLLFKSHLLP